MEYKRGRRGAYHTKGQLMNTKERRKIPPLRFSNLQRMYFLGENEESRMRVFVFAFQIFESWRRVYDYCNSLFPVLNLIINTHLSKHKFKFILLIPKRPKTSKPIRTPKGWVKSKCTPLHCAPWWEKKIPRGVPFLYKINYHEIVDLYVGYMNSGLLPLNIFFINKC